MIPAPRLETEFAVSWPPSDWQDTTTLVAVSGGADSVALLRVMHRLKTAGAGRLLAAHFNHQLRGDESTGDEAFVASLCRELKIPCEIGRAASDAPVASQGDGIEAAARDQRYAFLVDAAHRLGARYLATAHTADDQAETILHRILRGTGIAGLAGIGRTRPLSEAVTLVRPLLGIRRTDVEAYLREVGQSWRDDSSNRDAPFTRNRIRHELLPLLARDYNPAAVDALVRLGQLADDVQRVIGAAVAAVIERAVDYQADGVVVIDTSRLAGVDRHLVRELFVSIWQTQAWPLQPMGFAHWNSLADLALGGERSGGVQILPGCIEAQKKGARLTLARL